MMEKNDYQFEDYLSEIHQDYKEAILQIHESLQKDGYKVKVESKSGGFFVSYAHPKTKRSVLNLLSRKKGRFIRIYADNFHQYADLLNHLTDAMEKEIAKAPVCKRLINPEDCNPKCIKGYDFSIKGIRYQKCRYNCFQFEITPESIPVISDFIEHERIERLSV